MHLTLWQQSKTKVHFLQTFSSPGWGSRKTAGNLSLNVTSSWLPWLPSSLWLHSLWRTRHTVQSRSSFSACSLVDCLPPVGCKAQEEIGYQSPWCPACHLSFNQWAPCHFFIFLKLTVPKALPTTLFHDTTHNMISISSFSWHGPPWLKTTEALVLTLPLRRRPARESEPPASSLLLTGLVSWSQGWLDLTLKNNDTWHLSSSYHEAIIFTNFLFLPCHHDIVRPLPHMVTVNKLLAVNQISNGRGIWNLSNATPPSLYLIWEAARAQSYKVTKATAKPQWNPDSGPPCLSYNLLSCLPALSFLDRLSSLKTNVLLSLFYVNKQNQAHSTIWEIAHFLKHQIDCELCRAQRLHFL